MKTAIRPKSTPVRELEKIIENWRGGNRSIMLTLNGRLRFEVKDDASFQLLLDLLGRLEDIAAIQQGLDDFKTGKSMTLAEFKKRARKKNGISG